MSSSLCDSCVHIGCLLFQRGVYKEKCAFYESCNTKWINVTDRLPDKDYNHLLIVTPSFYEAHELYYDICGYALNLHKVDEFDFPIKKPGFYMYISGCGFCECNDVIAWKEIEPYAGQ